jgi:hypothetical protein
MPKHADTPVSTPPHPARCPGGHPRAITRRDQHGNDGPRAVPGQSVIAVQRNTFGRHADQVRDNPPMIKRPKGDEWMWGSILGGGRLSDRHTRWALTWCRPMWTHRLRPEGPDG